MILSLVEAGQESLPNQRKNMISEMAVLNLVCQRLNEASISYMLTGSFAANFYAVPRMTRDIDLVIEIQKQDVEKILQLFEKDFYIDKASIEEALQYQSMFNIIHQESVFKIDFIIRKHHPYRKAEFQRRRQIQWNGQPLWIVSPEDLILSKLFWAQDSLSNVQLRDVKNLLDNISNLDKEYIQKWLQELHLEHVYEKVTNLHE